MLCETPGPPQRSRRFYADVHTPLSRARGARSAAQVQGTQPLSGALITEESASASCLPQSRPPCVPLGFGFPVPVRCQSTTRTRARAGCGQWGPRQHIEGEQRAADGAVSTSRKKPDPRPPYHSHIPGGPDSGGRRTLEDGRGLQLSLNLQLIAVHVDRIAGCSHQARALSPCSSPSICILSAARRRLV